MQSFVAKLFGEQDEELLADFSKHARMKILDITKAIGAVVTLGVYDYDLASESLQLGKLTKAFNQGSKSATDNHLKAILEKTDKLQSIEFNSVDRNKIEMLEDAVKSFVTEVSMVQQSLTEHNSAGLASRKGLVGSLSPMVDAVANVKQSTQPKQVVTSFRELKNACRTARSSVNTFESSMLSGVHR